MQFNQRTLTMTETVSHSQVTTAATPKQPILTPHLVVSVADLKLKDPKIRYFARFLAHQSLHSEEDLSLEVLRKTQMNNKRRENSGEGARTSIFT